VTDEPSRLAAHTKMRAAIARRMTLSKREAPHFYVSADVALDDVIRRLDAANADRVPNERVTITAVLIRAVADALTRHPLLNAHWSDDGHEVFDEINVGVAVAVDDGLIAPALLDCAPLGIPEISRRLADLAGRARAGKLRVAEMNKPTFTLSNMGKFDVTGFTAILNPPQVGILATGTAAPRAVVVDGEVVVRTVMAMTLSADHRAVDGAYAAGFVGTVRQRLEDPSVLLWEDEAR